MERVTKHLSETGEAFNFSPEFWLAEKAASQLEGDFRFGDLVEHVTKQAAPPSDARFVFDTGTAREGLLDFPILGEAASVRRSNKKVAQEGDLIVSRLRPYLRQAALIPSGAMSVLGITDFYLSTEFLVFRSREGTSLAGLLAWVLSNPIQKMMSEAATGGHHPRISADLLLNAPVEANFLDDDLSKEVESVVLTHLKGQFRLRRLLTN